MSGKETRQKLVETAMQLFWEQGYAATGIAQILKVSGVHSGSLYHFFPTKEDLLIAVLEWYWENLFTQVMNPAKARASDPIERVFAVLDGYRQLLVMTGCAKGCPIGNLALEVSDSHPGARVLIAANFAGWRDAIRDLLDEAAGRLPPDTDTLALANFVLTTMEGAVMLARAERTLEPYLAAVNQLRDYFDRLLADGTSWSQPRSEGR
jgi:TetR/AcrR family transcriptional regulator, transcriptional repressor for nem operon